MAKICVESFSVFSSPAEPDLQGTKLNATSLALGGREKAVKESRKEGKGHAKEEREADGGEETEEGRDDEVEARGGNLKGGKLH